MGSIEEMIFKELRWDLNMDVDDYEYVRMDAFVTERLTSHKQITDIYGYCGLSMLTGTLATCNQRASPVASLIHFSSYPHTRVLSIWSVFKAGEISSELARFCGLISGRFIALTGDIEKDVVGFQHHRKDFKPWTDKEIPQLNNFTGAEKLQLALNMVEPGKKSFFVLGVCPLLYNTSKITYDQLVLLAPTVAALHNYPGKNIDRFFPFKHGAEN